MACTTDNATNNDTFLSLLQTKCESEGIGFATRNNHVRCLAHVINLAAQAALLKLKVAYIDDESEILNNNNEINDVIPKVSIYIIYLIKSIDFNIYLLYSFESLSLRSVHRPKKEKSLYVNVKPLVNLIKNLFLT